MAVDKHAAAAAAVVVADVARQSEIAGLTVSEAVAARETVGRLRVRGAYDREPAVGGNRAARVEFAVAASKSHCY